MRVIILMVCSLFVLVGFSQRIPSEREMKMIDEINYVRTNPTAYIPYISEYLDIWDEGKSVRKVADELIDILKKMDPLDSLQFSQELYEDAVAHGNWMKKKNAFEHSKLEYAENLVGGDEKPRYAIVSLLIDDGVPSRGHRKNLLNPAYKFIACHEVLGEVKGQKFVFVQLFK